MVDVNPPRICIRDLGSTNHTFVNGRRVNTSDLVEGDVVKLGANTLILVRSEASGLAEIFEEEDHFVETT
jgi:pSer/pThr/pTyr-binding forkhead associated (FHA) protein